MRLWHILSFPVKAFKSANESVVLAQHLWILADATTIPLICPTTQVKGYEKGPEFIQIYKRKAEIQVSLFSYIHRSENSNDLHLFHELFHKPYCESTPASLSWMQQSLADGQFSHSSALSSYMQPASQWENSSLSALSHSLHIWKQKWLEMKNNDNYAFYRTVTNGHYHS